MDSSEQMIKRNRASVVCVKNGHLLVVRAIDPVSKKEYLVLPGGGVEENEPPIETAKREALEETGYSVVIDEGRAPVVSSTPFMWAGQLYDTTTSYFFANVNGETPIKRQNASYEVGVEWLPFSRVFSSFSYNPVIQRSVCSFSSSGPI